MLLDNLKESAAYIKSITGDIKFDIAMVLGSGLGDMAETLGEVIYIPYSEIPHFPVSTVPGHKGRLAIGLLEGKRVVSTTMRDGLCSSVYIQSKYLRCLVLII